MPFSTILMNLVENIPQAIGAIVIDWEGEAVQEFCRCDPYQTRFFGAHQEIILGRLAALHQEFKVGTVDSLSISTSTHHLVIGCINHEYSLALHLHKSSGTATELHHFRTALVELRREFE